VHASAISPRDDCGKPGVEYAAVTEQPLSSTFDIAPMWKMYMEPIELWKKNYETFLKSTPGTCGLGGAGSATSFYDGALLQWQKTGEELFQEVCAESNGAL
jgi:hypothetical protein